MFAGIVPPRRGQLAAGVVAWLTAPRLMAGPEDQGDMATTIEAEDDFYLGDCANPIAAPTLIVAGREDRFYSPELFEETARLIPNSRLHVFDGRGHVTVTMHPKLAPEVRSFLDEG
jgi:pimeloyl-ACP methyl ester carboxylesterase